MNKSISYLQYVSVLWSVWFFGRHFVYTCWHIRIVSCDVDEKQENVLVK
jgi:hypothetical protein